MASRPQRSKGPSAKQSSKLSALERLKLARENGGRDEQFEMPEEENVYDVLDEESYKQTVNSRREREDFVVDDEGIGYHDDGEEHIFDREDGKKKDGNKRTQGNGISKDTLKKARKLTGLQAATEKPTGNMHAFLQKGPQTGPKATSASTGTRKPQGSQAKPSLDLDSLLDNLGAAKPATTQSRSKKTGGKKGGGKKRALSSVSSARMNTMSSYAAPASASVGDHMETDDYYQEDDGPQDAVGAAPMVTEPTAGMSAADNSAAAAEPAKEDEVASAPVKKSRFAKRTANVSLAPSAAAQAAEKAAEVKAMGGGDPGPSNGFSAVKSLGDAALPTGMVLESSSSGPSISRLEPSRWLSTDEETKETYLDMLV